MTVDEQLDKLLYSIERFQKEENKRLAVGHMDFVKDRAISIIHMLIAEIKDEEGKL